jgi:sugar (pentulose or hexulose) kinase
VAVAVIDIGKSNAKLALVDEASGAVGAIRTTLNTVVTVGAYPHYDVDGLWQWLLAGLREFATLGDVTTISVTTHGACFVLLAGDKPALPVLDYEFAAPESVRAAYAAVRGDFAETLSPDLPNGLNAGRQIYWQDRAFPREFARVDAILPYPQYWAFRLTGAKVAEATSLGCHTDLWDPRAATYSRLAVAERWDRLFPRLVKPWDTAGSLLPEIARATGLASTCRVVAGIHDSNASLLPHLLSRAPPFAVLSTGTWMVTFAPGGSLDRLDRARDCLANVDAFGRAVPSSRFMAGREHEIIAGAVPEAARDDDVARVVSEKIMALPTFAPGTGPFGARRGGWATRGRALPDPWSLPPRARSAAASLYAALVTETCLGLAGAEGPVVVEGPFAKNPLFLAALAQRVPRPVIARPNATGTTDGAALLARGPDVAAKRALVDAPPVAPLALDLAAYSEAWRESAG